MFLPRVTPSKLLYFSLVVVAFLASLQLTQAKSIRSLGYSNLRNSDAIKMRRGGCAAFGHSCFGGHGKRAEAAAGGDAEDAGMQPSSEDARGYDQPRTLPEAFANEQSDNAELNLLFPSQYHEPEDYLKFSPFFKKWLANSYRRGDLIPVNK